MHRRRCDLGLGKEIYVVLSASTHATTAYLHQSRQRCSRANTTFGFRIETTFTPAALARIRVLSGPIAMCAAPYTHVCLGEDVNAVLTTSREGRRRYDAADGFGA